MKYYCYNCSATPCIVIDPKGEEGANPFMCPWSKQERMANWITEEQVKEEMPCYSCGGSGYYDSSDKHGNTIKCRACRGTGIRGME